MSRADPDAPRPMQSNPPILPTRIMEMGLPQGMTRSRWGLSPPTPSPIFISVSVSGKARMKEADLRWAGYG